MSHPLDNIIEPQALGDIIPSSQITQLSLAISAKRQADALERIAAKLDDFDVTIFGNRLLDIAYQAGVNFRGKQ